MDSLAKADKYADPALREVLSKIVCTTIKFTQLNVDAVALRVDRHVANTQTATYKKMFKNADEGLKSDLQLLNRINEGAIKRLEVAPMPFKYLYLSALTIGEEELTLRKHLHQIMEWVAKDRVKVLGLEILGTITNNAYPPHKALQMIGRFLFYSLREYPAHRLHKVVLNMEISRHKRRWNTRKSF